jgi:hypothetical protein
MISLMYFAEIVLSFAVLYHCIFHAHISNSFLNKQKWIQIGLLLYLLLLFVDVHCIGLLQLVKSGILCEI